MAAVGFSQPPLSKTIHKFESQFAEEGKGGNRFIKPGEGGKEGGVGGDFTPLPLPIPCLLYVRSYKLRSYSLFSTKGRRGIGTGRLTQSLPRVNSHPDDFGDGDSPTLSKIRKRCNAGTMSLAKSLFLE